MREPVPHRASDVVALVGLVLATIGLPGAAAGQEVAWPAYAADAAVTKYSPLDQINRDTIADVEIVWRQPVIPEVTRQGNMTRGPLLSQNTPLMVGGLLYVSTGLGSVAALDATTGEVVWNDEPILEPGADAPVRTRQTRGVAYWTDGEDERVIATRGPMLVALNAKTGARYPDFGEVGEVDLRLGLMREFPDYYWNSAPLVINDVIIVGSFVLDYTTNQQPATKQSARGDVRGYDVRTGEPVWPIEERPVPPSPVPGERLAATQPVPTKPPAFDLQGVSLDDLAGC